MNEKQRAAGSIRPTSSKTASALFNILRSRVALAGASFLDLFSGTGGISRMALDEGAAVTAVEADRSAAAAIRGALAPRGAEVITADVRRALPTLARRGRAFDIVFADPPYCCGWADELLDLIEANDVVARPGILIIERSSRETPRDALREREDRAYGETVLSIYRYE